MTYASNRDCIYTNIKEVPEEAAFGRTSLRTLRLLVKLKGISLVHSASNNDSRELQGQSIQRTARTFP